MEKSIKLNNLTDIVNNKNEEIILDLAENISVKVIPHLSFEEKVKLIEDIVVACAYGGDPYMNPLKLKVFTALKLLSICTNIDILDSEDISVYEIYDILNDSGVLETVLPHTEYQEILNWSYECAEELFKYKNSFVGIIDSIKDSFNIDELKNQFSSIVEELKNNPDLINLAKLYEEEGLAN